MAGHANARVLASLLCLVVASCDANKPQTMSVEIALSQRDAGDFRLVIDNRSATAICFPSNYSRSSEGNLVIRSASAALSPTVNADSAGDWTLEGPFYIVPANSKTEIRYNMDAYRLVKGERYDYRLIASYRICDALERGSQVAGKAAEVRATGTFVQP